MVTDSIIKLLIWILNEDQTLVSLSNSITTHRSINYVLGNIMSNFCFFNACNDEVGGTSLFFSNVLVLLSDFSSSSFSPCPSLVEGVDSSAILAAFLFPTFNLICNFLSTGSFEAPIFYWHETFAPSPSLRQHEECYYQHPMMNKKIKNLWSG